MFQMTIAKTLTKITISLTSFWHDKNPSVLESKNPPANNIFYDAKKKLLIIF